MKVRAAVHGAWSCEELESFGLSESSFYAWSWSVSAYHHPGLLWSGMGKARSLLAATPDTDDVTERMSDALGGESSKARHDFSGLLLEIAYLLGGVRGELL